MTQEHEQEKENISTKQITKNNDTKSLLLFALIVLAIVLPIRIFVAKPFLVSGQSMFPTFDSWHYLIVDQLTYHFSEPKRGDVIVFHYPRDPKRFFIKRIIALPKETIHLEGTSVTIKNSAHTDGFLIEEPYVKPKYQKRTRMTVTLGGNEYFVMGDNRSASADSRYWGPLERQYIVGRVFVRLFPFTLIDAWPGAAKYQKQN